MRTRNQFYRTFVVSLTLVILSGGALFASGQKESEPPEINMPAQPRQYVSPQNSDGVKDALELPFSSVVAPAPEMVIVRWDLSIFDTNGELVWTKSDRQTQRRSFFQNLFGADKPRVEVPDTLSWDGTFLGSTLGSDGESVPDGDYTYQLTITDDQGNVARTPPFNVTVDNTAPTIDPFKRPAYLVFSPNNDGVRDTVTLLQSGSREFNWTGTISDADGNVVWSKRWENSSGKPSQDAPPPAEVTWDGTYEVPGGSRNGEQVPEGQYSYQLTGTDRAGNTASNQASWKITMSLQAGSVQLAVADGSRYFSPNGDGVQDTLTLESSMQEPEGIASWNVEISLENDPTAVVRTISGEGMVRKEISFDGVGDNGRPLSDGNYLATLTAQYDNGTTVSSEPTPIVIDTTAPQASILADTLPESTRPGSPLVFGGTDKKQLELRVNLSSEGEWMGVLETPDGTIKTPLSDLGVTSNQFTYDWNGTQPDGTPAPDGMYSLYVESTDQAGNTGKSRVVRVRKDTRATPINLTVDGNALAPNGEGTAGSVGIHPRIEVTDGIQEVLLEIRNESGRIVRTRYTQSPFETFDWKGENNAGQPVEDGTYTVDLQVNYYNGNKPRVAGVGPIEVSGAVGLSTNLRITASPLPFSPDGDGVNDSLQLKLESPPNRTVSSWAVQITDPMGNDFITWKGSGEPQRFITWDGKARNGELVQAGMDYKAIFSVTSPGGAVASTQTTVPIDVLVIREGNRLVINVPSIHFAGFSSDLFDVKLPELEKNLQVIRRIAQILQRYPDYQITVEGHAAHIFWREGPQKRAEQQQVLIPLSRDRAQEVKEALIIIGIDGKRMKVVGLGGSDQAVPDSDRQNMWKNRRVRFILEKR